MLQKLTTTLGIIISLIVLISATFYISFWRGINASMQDASEEIIFTVDTGSGSREISDKLQENGLIKSSFYFDWYTAFKKIDKRMQAGEYSLNKDMNIKEIALALSTGNALSKEKTVKIIEGWAIKDIASYLEKEYNFKAKEFINLTKSGKGTCFAQEICQFSQIDSIPAGSSLEGYLFPDTYRIFEDATLEEVIAKILNNFENKITDEMLADIKKQDKSLHEIIIMASLIEKEVRKTEDMKVVSGIFWNRIERGQPLESCATLAYILGENKPQYSIEDTKIDSPYNSYQNYGLTPGPISNPGLNAIKAAIYPTKTNYLYFLNELESGKTHFAEIFNEHIENKRLYLK